MFLKRNSLPLCLFWLGCALKIVTWLVLRLFSGHCSVLGLTTLKCKPCCSNSSGHKDESHSIVSSPAQWLSVSDPHQRPNLSASSYRMARLSLAVFKKQESLVDSISAKSISLEASILAARCDKAEGNFLKHLVVLRFFRTCTHLFAALALCLRNGT